MGSKVVVSSDLLGKVATEVDGAASLADWGPGSPGTRSSALGSGLVVDAFVSASGEQQRRSQLLVDALRAVSQLASTTAEEFARAEDELEGAARG